MVGQILIKQLETAALSHERESDRLVTSLVGLSKKSRQLSSGDWVDRLDESIEILQSRDSVQQQIQGVHTIMNKLQEYIVDAREKFADNEPLPPFEELMQEIYESYVMSSQRDIHHQITGIRESSENMERIQLF